MTKHPPMHHPLKHVLIWLRINPNQVVGLTTIYVVQYYGCCYILRKFKNFKHQFKLSP
jgi:hypothetical protein